MNQKLLAYLESSFISELLLNQSITDVSYNGVAIFYMDNLLGRKKAKIKISSQEAQDFIRQIANYSEKQFSYTEPVLDISVGKYRINAVHSSIVRVGNEKSISFCIRIASQKSRIDSSFIPNEVKDYLFSKIENGESLVIAGPTGSGKTELQKYLLSNMSDNTRILIIDNVQELEYVRENENLDITSWQVNQFNNNGSTSELIRNALRSNPDWLVIAEARGQEMNEVLNSVMTGHPIITTLHAKAINNIPHRMARMVEMSNSTEKYEDILNDIYEHIGCYIYVNRKISKNGKVNRFIQSVGEIHDGKMNIVYERKQK